MKAKRIWIAALFATMLLLIRAPLHGQPPTVREVPGGRLTPQRALAELKRLGGILVHYDDRQPGNPVIMLDLTAHSKFKDAWTRYFPVFPRLRQVGLSGTPLTDAGLGPFKEIAELDALFLAETQITDAGLARLAGCKRLRLLDISGTRVTKAGVAELQAALPELEIIVEPEKLAADSPPNETDARSEPENEPSGLAGDGQSPIEDTDDVTRFTANEIRQWRQRLTELGQLPKATPDGWSKSRVDPAKLLSVFPELRLREGHVLRAYVFKEDGNSNGFVWALPADADFPEPEDCPRLETHFLNPPKPFDALDDLMEAIEGDDSPESYLHASILRREFKEFGSGWHGIKWGMNAVLDESPWKGSPPSEEESPTDRPRSKLDEWTWLSRQPATWSPEVRMEQNRVVVTFYSYTPLAGQMDDGEVEKERIYRHTDTYRRGKYRAGR